MRASGQSAREGLGEHAVDRLLLLHGGAHDAGEERHFGLGDAPFLEAARAGQFTEAVSNELVDHRLGVFAALLALEQRLHRGDA